MLKHRLVVDIQTKDASGAQAARVAGPALPTTAPLVRALLGLDLCDQAIDELPLPKGLGRFAGHRGDARLIFHQQGQG